MATKGISEGPGYSESGETKTASEIMIIERHAGTFLAAQVIVLEGEPFEPFLIEIWNNTKRLWERVNEADYTLVFKTVTFGATYKIPTPASSRKDDQNIRITYITKCTANGSSISEARQLNVSGTIELRAANPAESIDLAFSPITGKGHITRIIITRTANAGTAYNAASRTVDIYDRVLITPPTVANLLFSEHSLEPQIAPNPVDMLINQTDVNFGNIKVTNPTPASLGYISVTMTAAGGDGTSEEDYLVQIQGEREA